MKPRYVIILAAKKSEGYQYAHRAGIPARYCRIPLRAGQMAGIKSADIHVLPSFHGAPHRHSILSAIRKIRGVNVDLTFFDVEMPPKAEEAVADEGDGMGPQLSLEDLLAEIDREEVRVADLRAQYAERYATDFDRGEEAAIDPLQAEVDAGLIEPLGWEMPKTLDEYLENGGANQVLQQMANADRYDLHRAATIAFRYEAIKAADADDTQDAADEEFSDSGRWGAPDTGATGETSAEALDDEEPEAPISKPKRRRSRCPDCGELRFPEDHVCANGAAEPVAQTPRERLTGGFF